jgi:hypothetical protein
MNVARDLGCCRWSSERGMFYLELSLHSDANYVRGDAVKESPQPRVDSLQQATSASRVAPLSGVV